MGTPRPSICTERLTPILPRSVGFFPVFFPAQRRLVHRPIQALPFPVDALQLVVFFQRDTPQLLEYAQLNPLLKIGMDGAARTELARHRLPLATCYEHIENSVGNLS